MTFYVFNDDVQIKEVEAESIHDAFIEYHKDPNAPRLLAICYRKMDAEFLQVAYLKEVRWQ